MRKAVSVRKGEEGKERKCKSGLTGERIAGMRFAVYHMSRHSQCRPLALFRRLIYALRWSASVRSILPQGSLSDPFLVSRFPEIPRVVRCHSFPRLIKIIACDSRKALGRDVRLVKKIPSPFEVKHAKP